MADTSAQVLTAMITPAVLISGAGTLLMSTSTRVGRATDRLRQLNARFKVLVSEEGQREPLAAEEQQMIQRQLPRLAYRSRLLVRAMTSIYFAVALLVVTSILIGTDRMVNVNFGVLPEIIAVLGATALAYGALILSFEIRLSARTTKEEMEFLLHLGQHFSARSGTEN